MNSAANTDVTPSLPGPLSLLLREHHGYRAVANLLSRRAVQTGPLRENDYLLMRDLVLYLRDYPELVHHPLENQIAALLSRHSSYWQRLEAKLVDDHSSLEESCSDLLKHIETALKVPAKALENKIQGEAVTLAKQIELHLSNEEAHFFPKAAELLTPKQWRSVQKNLKQVQDPLFGKFVENRFRLIYEYFINEPSDRYEAQERRAILFRERIKTQLSQLKSRLRQTVLNTWFV